MAGSLSCYAHDACLGLLFYFDGYDRYIIVQNYRTVHVRGLSWSIVRQHM